MSGLYLLQSNERWIIGPSFSHCQEGCLWHTPAGIVINLVEYIKNGVVLRDAWGSAMQELGKPAQISGSAILIFNVWGFLLGIAAVWLYAAIRRRYGAGPNTAIRAGLVTWGIAVPGGPVIQQVLQVFVGALPSAAVVR
jgi:hypothetical protein